jgi:enoyl-CoA hydratase/carnithine racemase
MADLELRQDGEVVWATMNRPARLNALSRGLVTELREFFVGLYWRRDVRVVVLQGAGDNFCAGLDLKERSDPQGARSIGTGLTRQREISEIVIAMRRCPQPIVACVNGAAAGGGFALALASDVRVATPSARMNAPFIRIGLSACDIGVSFFLPRMVGSSVAAEYMLTGRFIDAERAYQLGLVSRVVPKDQLEAAIAMEDRNQILASQDGDFAEGVRAFLEKRAPNYERREG